MTIDGTDDRRPGLWIGLALGTPVMVFGVIGAINDADRTHPAALVRWMLGSALAHDLVLAPIVLAVGWGLSRLFRRETPAWMRWAMATSTMFVLMAWPFVRGYGEDSTMPSALPRNYATGLAAYLMAVWVIAAFAAGVTRLRNHERAQTTPED